MRQGPDLSILDCKSCQSAYPLYSHAEKRSFKLKFLVKQLYQVPTQQNPRFPTGFILLCNYALFKQGRIMRPCLSLPSRAGSFNYSMISVTTPDPTVLPPSLMANLSPSSIAIGVISAISITTLSPGMHISVPSGNCRSPVTSVVLK